MKLITTDEQLRSFLPNIVQTVKGETPFIDRLQNYLNLAEDWVKSNITSELVFDTICYLTEDNTLKNLISRLVVADALRRAIPSLDIILTPNGFGSVNSSNIAPASKPRVDRLVGSMLAHRDDCIAALLIHLVTSDDWLTSPQGKFFGSTLFPDLSIVDSITQVIGSKWEKYLELQPQILDLETSLAEEWFSPELMKKFRHENIRNTLTPKRKSIVLSIQTQIVAYLKGGTLNSRKLADIVNHIRQDPETFPEWHSSDTAQLFSPPVFRNKKKAAGYFF